MYGHALLCLCPVISNALWSNYPLPTAQSNEVEGRNDELLYHLGGAAVMNSIRLQASLQPAMGMGWLLRLLVSGDSGWETGVDTSSHLLHCSHRLPNTICQVGEQYCPSIAPFARARCAHFYHF